MAESPKPVQELNGWKEISAYLRVSIRTAQTLEKGQGLPVHRGVGSSKAPVHAIPSELDAWKANLSTAQPIEEPRIAQVAPIVETGRRHWLRYAMAGGVGALAASGVVLGASKLWTHNHQPPSAYRVEGATLIVTGKEGVELWRYTFPEQMLESVYKQGHKQCIFADVAGDGRVRTIFSYVPIIGGYSGHNLACFSAEGKLCWTYAAGRTVTDNRGRQFAPPYWPSCFEILRSKSTGASRIAVTSLHNWSFPTQVAVLDGQTGELLSEYWHRGHVPLIAVADLDADGEPEVLLGGVNDAPEYKQATLVVLDSRSIFGSSRDPQGVAYFQGMEPVAEKCVIFFPRTPIGRTQEFNQVAAVRLTEGRIVVVVDETPGTQGGAVIYEFDYGLKPVNVSLSITIQKQFNEMQEGGKLPRESPYVIADRLMKQIKVVHG